MLIAVTVKPGSKKGPLIIENIDGSLMVFLRQRALDGAANEALVVLLAAHYAVSKSSVTIESGFKSRIKRVYIDS